MTKLEQALLEALARERKERLKEGRPGLWPKVLEFLNTSLGIFLLSTVFISTFSWTANWISNRQQEHRQAAATRQKLGLEIMNRVRYIELLKGEFEYQEYHRIRSAVEGYAIGRSNDQPWIRRYTAAFPEYQSRSFVSLLWELQGLSVNEDREKIRSVREPVNSVESYLARLEYHVEAAPRANEEGKREMLGLAPGDRVAFERNVLSKIIFLKDPAFYEDK
jgi:hypothetical protein